MAALGRIGAATVAAARVEVFYDVVSPYSYLALEALSTLRYAALATDLRVRRQIARPLTCTPARGAA